MVRNIANIILMIVVLVGGWWYYDRYLVLCNYPIKYSVGRFDSRFGFDRDLFLKTLREAESVWEEKVDRELFSYQTDAPLRVNLIYDDRQAQSDAALESEEKIEGTRAGYDQLVSQYRSKEASYNRDLGQYRSGVTSYEKSLASYNAQVSQTNQRGGARPTEYSELEAQRRKLETSKAELERLEMSLRSRAAELNGLAVQINTLAKKYNFEVTVHNQVFGTAREFEQGQFQQRGGSREINIYQYSTPEDLRLVVAHEFGHALDLDHVENSQSLMYYLLEKQDMENPELTQEDLIELRSKCDLN